MSFVTKNKATEIVIDVPPQDLRGRIFVDLETGKRTLEILIDGTFFYDFDLDHETRGLVGFGEYFKKVITEAVNKRRAQGVQFIKDPCEHENTIAIDPDDNHVARYQCEDCKEIFVMKPGAEQKEAI